jgi:putative transposase
VNGPVVVIESVRAWVRQADIDEGVTGGTTTAEADSRLMRQAGIAGVSRKRRLRTTRPDPAAARPADLVKRDFTAARPNEL